MRSYRYFISVMNSVLGITLLTPSASNGTKAGYAPDMFTVAFDGKPRIEEPNQLMIRAIAITTSSDAELRFYVDSAALANKVYSVLWQGAAHRGETILVRTEVPALTESRTEFYAQLRFSDSPGGRSFMDGALFVIRDGSEIFTSSRGFESIEYSRAEKMRRRHRIMNITFQVGGAVALLVAFTGIMRLIKLRRWRKYQEKLGVGGA